jgi:CheY-like chemotaxis protein
MEMLGQEHFDLVISDIMMDKKDGLEFMREARAKWPHLDFIIMTGFADYSYSDIIEAGATDFDTKPFPVNLNGPLPKLFFSITKEWMVRDILMAFQGLLFSWKYESLQ